MKQSSLLRVAGNPAKYSDGYVTVTLALGSSAPYSELVEVRSVKDVEAAVLAARSALAGTDSAISCWIKQGRKPNGFEAWKAANRQLMYVHKEAA